MIYFTQMSDISIWPRFDYYTINFNAPNVTIVQYLWAINVRNIHEKVINFRANIRFPEMLREQISALTNSSRYCSMSVYACYFFIYSCLFIYFFAGSETHHWRELIILVNVGSTTSILYFFLMIIVSLFYSPILFFAC